MNNAPALSLIYQQMQGITGRGKLKYEMRDRDPTNNSHSGGLNKKGANV